VVLSVDGETKPRVMIPRTKKKDLEGAQKQGFSLSGDIGSLRILVGGLKILGLPLGPAAKGTMAGYLKWGKNARHETPARLCPGPRV